MVLKRVMPCLLFNGHGLIKTKQFSEPDYVGDPINAIKIFNEKEVDELIVLDVYASKEGRSPNFDMIRRMASECFMPFTYGGGVSCFDDFKKLYALGVEKIAVKAALHSAADVVKMAVATFGAQAVIGVVDVSYRSNQGYVPQGPDEKIKFTLHDYLKFLQDEIGVGEILLQNVDREGTWLGYDHALVKDVVQRLNIPVIALGGANSSADIRSVLYESGSAAAAIGSMAVYQKKDMGVLIRFPKRETMINEDLAN